MSALSFVFQKNNNFSAWNSLVFDLPIPVGLDWIASWPSLICFSVAMLAEVAALHDAVKKRLVDFARLGDALTRCRMMRVVQPYLEGLA